MDARGADDGRGGGGVVDVPRVLMGWAEKVMANCPIASGQVTALLHGPIDLHVPGHDEIMSLANRDLIIPISDQLQPALPWQPGAGMEQLGEDRNVDCWFAAECKDVYVTDERIRICTTLEQERDSLDIIRHACQAERRQASVARFDIGARIQQPFHDLPLCEGIAFSPLERPDQRWNALTFYLGAEQEQPLNGMNVLQVASSFQKRHACPVVKRVDADMLAHDADHFVVTAREGV